MRITLARIIVILVSAFLISTVSNARAETAFKIGGKAVTIDQIYKEDQASFYELDKKKFELIDRIARQKYMEFFWEKKAKEEGVSVTEAQKNYEKKNVKVSEKELKENLARFKDHPQLKKLSAKEKDKQIRSYLTEKTRRELFDGIIAAGIKKGDLKIVFKKPLEPTYKLEVTAADHVRYGPKDSDIKPMGCKGNACKITVIEYSEYQCPFCTRVLPAVKRLMTEYKGKVRWIVRDFPLGFHDRAKPAAVAAKCAAEQGKYWEMYSELFKNQRALADADLKKYGKTIGLDKKKYEACLKNPAKQLALIDKNYRSGMAVGVTGTPAFFVNGRRLSGAIPYGEFKSIFDEELAKK